MKVSLAVCILAALLGVGSCLQCELCNGLGNYCAGSTRTCAPGEDSCGIALTEATLVGTKTQSIVKGCVPSHKCKTGPFSMDFGKGLTTRTDIACCVGEACRTTTVTVPPADTEPNGRRCPACYGLSSEQCREETLDCTGAKTQCIAITETLTTGGKTTQVVMKGCASESICTQLKAGSRAFAGLSVNLTMAECRAASGAGGVAPEAVGLLLPALAGLLLLKLFS